MPIFDISMLQALPHRRLVPLQARYGECVLPLDPRPPDCSKGCQITATCLADVVQWDCVDHLAPHSSDCPKGPLITATCRAGVV